MAGRGRGGRGRGGPAAGRGGAQILGGREMTWDYDPNLVIDNTPQALYPPLKVPEPRGINPSERARVASFKSMRDRFQKGPMYTVLGDRFRVGKERRPRNNDYFSNMSYQSMFAKRPPPSLPRFNTRKYNLAMFPAELHHVLDHTKARVKAKQTARTDHDDAEAENDPDTEPEDEREAEAWRRKREAVAELEARRQAAKDHANRSDIDSDEERDQEMEANYDSYDDDYEGEDDDMAADYNAERYFANGEDDNESLGGDGEGEVDLG